MAISVIIPLDVEERVPGDLLRELDRLVEVEEIICVEVSGSEREWPEGNAFPLPRILSAPRGRAIQMNKGAGSAGGDWLWFLHADSSLSSEIAGALRQGLKSDANALFYFKLRFRKEPGARLCFLNEWGAAFRSQVFGLPFGDQGFLLPREVFHRLGGFSETTFCGEDHHFVWQCHRQRIPVQELPAVIYTSARKYCNEGWWKVTKNHLLATWRQAIKWR